MSVANRPERPLSPHLQVYRPQLTTVLSILHRATGIALSVGALYLATWVMYAAASPKSYALFQSFNVSIVGRIVLGGWLFSAFWDAGYGFELKDAYRSGWIVVGLSLVATAVSWVVGLRLM